MRMLLVGALIAFLLVTRPVTADEFKVEDGFTSLFDGKTLDGWEGDEKTFSVRDGAIVAGTLKAPIPRNEFLCSKKRYSNFELRLQVKLVGDGQNAGVQFRTERIPNHFEVIGYQADIGVMGKDRLIWGALYDESRRRKFLMEGDQDELQKRVRKDDWNDVVIHADGSHITITVNGLKTVDFEEKDADIATEGVLALQIHGGGPAEASYRHIRIRELTSKAKK